MGLTLAERKVSRLDTLDRLAIALNSRIPFISERSKFLESSESYLVPTIGAEIEISWKSVMPDYDKWFNEKYSDFSKEKKEDFDERCTYLDRELKLSYNATVEAGIPNGKKSFVDGYHEFAHRPVNWYETLSAEIEMLMRSELRLIPNGHAHPMHITLGGVKWSNDVGIATGIIELLDGSNEERLTSPESSSLSWSRAGICGIKSRNENEMEGRYSSGVEIRTLIANNPMQVRTTLRAAQLLGATIMAYQTPKHIIKIHEELDEVWESLRERMIIDILKPHNLNKWWSHPTHDREQWERFGSLYGKPETNRFVESVKGDLNYVECLIKDYLTK